MEFHIERDPLLKALSRIQTVVERRNTVPILGNALLEARENLLTISATDTEVSLRTICAATIEQPGGLTVSARMLFEIVRELPPASVRLRQEGGDRLRLTCGRARFDLAGLPVEQFPEIPQPEGSARFVLDHTLLAEMLTKTHFAMSNDETRFTLNGLFLQLTPPEEASGPMGRIRLVATDTHRMAMMEKFTDWPEGITEPWEVIIPKKTVHEIRKLLEEVEQPVELAIGGGFIQFIQPEITLVSKLIDGRFPNFRRVIPSANKLRLDINREELFGVVRRMSVLSHEKSRGIRLAIDGELMKISTTNPENDAGEEELAVTFDGDKPLSIGFNARYMRDLLGIMEGEVVRFVLSNHESPALVFSPEQEEALFVLMPMRV